MKKSEQGEGGRKYGAMNKKKLLWRKTVSEGGVTRKKLRESLGETEREGQRQKLQNRNDRSSWRGEGGRAAEGKKGEKQSVKWREESKRQRPLSIQAKEMADGDVDR